MTHFFCSTGSTIDPPAQRGFTLIELMITVAILAILAAVATPSLMNMVQDNRIKSHVSELQNTLAVARSTAIAQNTNVRVCGSNTSGASCTGDWGNGWVSFVDRNGNTTPQTDEILHIVNDVSPQITTAVAANTTITYNGQGFLANGQGTIDIADDRGTTSCRLTIGASGHVTLSRTPGQQRCPGIDASN